MLVHVPKETAPERRVAAVPETVRRLCTLGHRVSVEAGAGAGAMIGDDEFVAAGAAVAADPAAALAEAEIVLRVQAPPAAALAGHKPGCLHLSFFNPFADDGRLAAFAAAGIDAVSLEMMPRSTIAQKMDALSSQASLAGYAAVLAAASRLPKILPMMMTPAGTLQPARFFIIGVGVAGLQAIATAKRLGARVEAFDTRPVVEEQVRSLGARFVRIDLGETGQTAQGYARELSPEQLELQRAGMAKACATADVVITTAKLFGRPAPVLVTAAMIAGMKRGSVVVDLAAETGGNVEGVSPGGEVVTANGVRIIGTLTLEAGVARDASLMFASNLANFLEHFHDAAAGGPALDPADEIVAGCLLTRAGKVVHPRFAAS
jgi:H+-translocating NAD(P) transhydrogenase subunit alpha